MRFLYFMKILKIKKPKLLLHICCAPCGAYVTNLLNLDYEVVLYFFNSNIFPENEHDTRLIEVKRIAKEFGLKLIIGDYNHSSWLEKITGKENEPEKGSRCRICYWERLENTALTAQKQKIDIFASTLSVSPHKDAVAINIIGKDLEEKYGVQFLDKDFKKQDGYKKSLELSKKYNFYRQNYCGCEFSRR